MKRLTLLALLAFCVMMIAVPAVTAQDALPTISGDVHLDLSGTLYDSWANVQFLATDQTSIGRRDIGWVVYTDKWGRYKLELDTVTMTCVNGGALMSGVVTRTDHWNYPLGKHVNMWVWDGRGRSADQIAPDLPQVAVLSGDLAIDNYAVGCPAP